MALDDIVRSAVATAKSITSSLQVTIKHEPWVDSNDSGAPLFGTPYNRQALVERVSRLVRDEDDNEVMSQTKVTLLGPVDPHGAGNRREPIDPRDRITLPGNITGPILSVNGLIDPNTDAPYLYEVWLG